MTIYQENHNAGDVSNINEPVPDIANQCAFLEGMVKGLQFVKSLSDWKRGLTLLKLQVELYLGEINERGH